jgi:hypothetical protein
VRLGVLLAIGWIILTLLSSLVRGPDPTPEVTGNDRPTASWFRRLDLGTVTYPSDAAEYRETRHNWRVSGHPPSRLTYAYGIQAMNEMYVDHARLGKRFGWPAQIVTSTRCRSRPWGCVYTAIAQRSEPDLNAVLDIMQSASADSGWSSIATARWLLAFVQDIPYRIPTEMPFEVLPPPLVVSENWGDCDSKSLLLLQLLRRAGIPATIFVSRAHAHAMVGIAVPTTGKTISHNGRRYAWAETTASAPIGWINPSFLTPNDWYAVEVRTRRTK